MQVSAVLVDEFESAASTPVVRAALYRFGRSSLVSARRLETKARIGPVAVLDDGLTTDVEHFPERALSWEGRRANAFSYREPWTVPPWTLYVLYPPADFFAPVLALEGAPVLGSGDFEAASSDDRLFYFALLGHARSQHAFQVEARFERDRGHVAELRASIETVRGRRRWETLREPVAQSLAGIGAATSTAAAVKTLFGL
jgi:hypothetical protein